MTSSTPTRIADFACPTAARPLEVAPAPTTPHLEGIWDASSLGRLARRLDSTGSTALAALADDDLLAGWDDAVRRLLDPTSARRRALDPTLAASLGFSAPALQAALEAMLGGFHGEPARRLAERATTIDRQREGLVLAVLAGNVPGLAVQVALPALAVRRPLLLKSSRREPLFTAALVEALVDAIPELADAIAAATWPGGRAELEAETLETARTVVAFGGERALEDLGRRHRRLIRRGPMLSLAVVAHDAPLQATAAALAEDVALFEQRGCLSVQAVYVEARGEELAGALAEALTDLAERWPPPTDAARLAAARQVRHEAELRGGRILGTELARGTVVLESAPDFRPLPAARAVRVHPLASLDRLEAVLEPLSGRIQGVALAGDGAWARAPLLERLGVRRLAPAGELQRPDALWASGERHLVEELA